MRSTTTLEIKVGLLILVGIVATVVLVLMTDRIRFDRFYTVKAYVSDAAGLRPNSPVTVDGIRVGDVVSLNAVGDPRGNIQVVIRINERSAIPSDSKLTIASSGIFGDSFLAFSGSADSNATPFPKDGTAEIQASRGFLDKASQQAENILAGVSDLLDEDMRNNVKRMMKGAADIAENGARLTKNLDDQTALIRESLTSLKALSEDLRKTVGALESRVNTSLTKVEDSLTKVDSLVVSTNEQILKVTSQAESTLKTFDETGKSAQAVMTQVGPDVGQTLAAARQLAERVDRLAAALENGDGVIGQLLVNKALAEDLNNTAIDLSRTAALIAEHPEVLVFGMSNEESAAQAARRERAKQRRSFHENYRPGIPISVEQLQPASDKQPMEK